MDFATLFPDLKPWVQSLAKMGFVAFIKESSWIFPSLLVFHLLGLVTVGGAILLPGLRLMGVGMTSESPASIEKTVRPWLWVGLVLLVISGVVMGMVNPMRLYTRPAFLVKVIALIPALILSFGVIRSIAAHDGAVTRNAKIMAGIALALWLLAVIIFGTAYGAAPGTFHVISAGWLIVMVFGSRMTRIVLGAITAVTVIVVGIVTYGFFPPLEQYDTFMDINRWTLRVGAVLIAGFALWEFARVSKAEGAPPRLNRLVGLLTILAWFTVAAAGRWIGLGGGAS
jgi:hypothetical protein